MFKWFQAALLVVVSAMAANAAGSAEKAVPPDPGEIAPFIRLLSPGDGAVFTSGEALHLSVILHAAPRPVPRQAKLIVTLADGARTRYVISHSLRLDTMPVFPEVVIPLQGIAAGSYVIAADVSIGELRLRDTTPVLVRAAPRLTLEPVKLEAMENAVRATFAARATTEDRAPIDSYVWHIGQGGPVVTTRAPVLTHILPLAVNGYDITLEARDMLGAVGRTTFSFALGKEDIAFFQDPGKKGGQDGKGGGEGGPKKEKPPPAPAANCGCQKMIIHTKKKSEIYCTPPAKKGHLALWDVLRCTEVKPEKSPCKKTERAFQCPLGRLAPELTLNPLNKNGTYNMANLTRSRLTYGFEVEATLVPGSQTKLCKEGQYAQGTVTQGGKMVNNPTAQPTPEFDKGGTVSLPVKAGARLTFKVDKPPKKIPAQGAKTYGQDDHSAVFERKRYDGNRRILWIDRPQTGIALQKPNKLGQFPVLKSLEQQSEFIAFVSGNKGACWCRFALDNKWVKADKNVTGTGITLSKAKPNGFNCEVR